MHLRSLLLPPHPPARVSGGRKGTAPAGQGTHRVKAQRVDLLPGSSPVSGGFAWVCEESDFLSKQQSAADTRERLQRACEVLPPWDGDAPDATCASTPEGPGSLHSAPEDARGPGLTHSSGLGLLEALRGSEQPRRQDERGSGQDRGLLGPPRP